MPDKNSSTPRNLLCTLLLTRTFSWLNLTVRRHLAGVTAAGSRCNWRRSERSWDKRSQARDCGTETANATESATSHLAKDSAQFFFHSDSAAKRLVTRVAAKCHQLRTVWDSDEVLFGKHRSCVEHRDAGDCMWRMSSRVTQTKKGNRRH